MYAFEFENVSFAYPGNTVLEHFMFKVNKGDFTAVVGPNGAGKSTLLKLCVGLLSPMEGQIKVLGEPIHQFKKWVKIGYVPQNALRDRNFPVTAEEVVSMGRVALAGIGKGLNKADRDRVEDSLKLVGMLDKRQSMIGELSGGQQQRVLIARALASDPEIMILDEPTAGVDSKAKESIYKLLKELNRDLGVTILIVSHDIECIAKYTSKVAQIDNGIRYYGSSEPFHQGVHLNTSESLCSSQLEKGEISNG